MTKYDDDPFIVLTETKFSSPPNREIGCKTKCIVCGNHQSHYQLLNKLHGVDVEVTPLKDFVGQCDDLDEAVLRPIEDARQTLTDKAKRREYDRKLAAL